MRNKTFQNRETEAEFAEYSSNSSELSAVYKNKQASKTRLLSFSREKTVHLKINWFVCIHLYDTLWPGCKGQQPPSFQWATEKCLCFPSDIIHWNEGCLFSKDCFLNLVLIFIMTNTLLHLYPFQKHSGSSQPPTNLIWDTLFMTGSVSNLNLCMAQVRPSNFCQYDKALVSSWLFLAQDKWVVPGNEAQSFVNILCLMVSSTFNHSPVHTAVFVSFIIIFCRLPGVFLI